MFDNECLGFTLNISIPSYIIYLILLCGDVESNPGPNLHNLQTFEDYEKRRGIGKLYPFLYIQILKALTTNTKKF